jgi:hypothetical protein
MKWDIVARFGGVRDMPREFFDDFVAVAGGPTAMSYDKSALKPLRNLV